MSRGQARIDTMIAFMQKTLFGVDSWPYGSPPAAWDQILFTPANRLHTELQFKSAITVDGVVQALQSHWTAATITEAESVLAALQSLKHVRRIGNVWKIIRPTRDPALTSSLRPYPYSQHVGSWKSYRDPQYNPGVCPRCNFKVENKNRHNNKIHTGNECRLNVVRSVLTE